MGQLIEQMKTVLPPLQRNRLIAVLVGNGLLRLANLGGTALVSFYLGMLMRGSSRYDEGLLAALTIVSSGAELLGAIPFGMLADRFSPRALLVWSALLGAAATQLFGISGLIVIFFLSRALEGLSAAAVTPAILAHLSDVTTGKKLIRGRIMGLFELSIFAGASLSSLLGSQLWEQFATLSFSLLSIVYLFVAILFYWGARPGQTHSPIIFENPLLGLKQVWANSRLRRLAPAWLAANTILALWVTFTQILMVRPPIAGQYLVGRFTPTEVGRIAFVYALTFGAGIVLWGEVLKKTARIRVMFFGVVGTFGTAICFYLINDSEGWTPLVRGIVILGYGLFLIVQAGFAPAALAYLVDVAGQTEGRGVAMGIYTVLLALGYVVASALGGNLVQLYYFNGLVLATLSLGLVCLIALIFLSRQEQSDAAIIVGVGHPSESIS